MNPLLSRFVPLRREGVSGVLLPSGLRSGKRAVSNAPVPHLAQYRKPVVRGRRTCVPGTDN